MFTNECQCSKFLQMNASVQNVYKWMPVSKIFKRMPVLKMITKNASVQNVYKRMPVSKMFTNECLSKMFTNECLSKMFTNECQFPTCLQMNASV